LTKQKKNEITFSDKKKKKRKEKKDSRLHNTLLSTLLDQKTIQFPFKYHIFSF